MVEANGTWSTGGIPGSYSRRNDHGYCSPSLDISRTSWALLNALGIRDIAYPDRHMLKSQKLSGSGSAPPKVISRVSSLAYRFHHASNPPMPHHSTVRSIVASMDSSWFL